MLGAEGLLLTITCSRTCKFNFFFYFTSVSFRTYVTFLLVRSSRCPCARNISYSFHDVDARAVARLSLSSHGPVHSYLGYRGYSRSPANFEVTSEILTLPGRRQKSRPCQDHWTQTTLLSLGPSQKLKVRL
jgi:hypothetical protein